MLRWVSDFPSVFGAFFMVFDPGFIGFDTPFDGF
jgi:hypothetical protein